MIYRKEVATEAIEAIEAIDWGAMTAEQAEALAAGFYAAREEATHHATEQAAHVVPSQDGDYPATAAGTQEREGE